MNPVRVRMRRFGPTPTQGFSGVIFNTASRVLCVFSRAVTCIVLDAKRTSMLIHTAIKNGNIPPVRGVTGLPGAMSGCGATCTSRGLPGVVGISGGSKVARWKATITAVIVVYLYCPKSVGSANGGQVSVSVGQRRIFSAQWHSSRAYRRLPWYQSA